MNVLTSIVVPLVTAIVVSGLILGLFRIKPERRQINAGAGKDEATTADILTGTALKMVVHAQDDAQHANTEVALTDGTVVAGPANPLPDNTVLN